MNQLPHGWSWAELGQIADVQWGNTSLTKASYVKEGYPAFSASGRDGFADHFEHAGPGIVLSAIGARCGKCFLANDKWTSIKNTITISEAAIERDFIFAFVNDEERWPQKGGAQPFITLKAARELSIPVAPLPEQRRIVAKIDSLSAKSRRSRDHLNHALPLVEKYKQAILAAAFRGELTREWRIKVGIGSDQTEFEGLPRELNGRPLPSSWKVKSISEAAINHDGKRIPVRASDRALRQGEFPYYGASGIIDTIDDYLFDGDFLLIGEDGANLISRSTPIAFLASGRFWVNNHAHILQAGPQTSNSWLCSYINMIDLVPFVTGTAQPKLTQAALNSIGVPLPSIQEHQEILHHIGTAFDWIDRLASEATSARKLIDHLDQAILAKAFRGELAPQDPNDEPASVLLKRIRAERATGSSKKARPARGQ